MRIVRATAAILIAAGLLAGCGRPATAAYVGDRHYTEDQVAEVVTEVPQVTGQMVSGPEVVGILLLTAATAEAAEEVGIDISLTEVRHELTALGLPADDLSDTTVEILRGNMIEQQVMELPEAQVNDVVARRDAIVKAANVNPRYHIDVTQMRPQAPPSWLESGIPGAAETPEG
ncbi:MAG: hypothetical protein Q4Q03_01815 [Bowdeniella nasicola]|nr:hypothetical protein [Bowdeniella nasicola]